MRRAQAASGAFGQAPVWWRRLEWAQWGVELRPVRSSDSVCVASALTDEIARWVGIGTADEMRDGTPLWAASAGELARRCEAFRYLVYRDGRFAGTVELRPDAVRGHIGYWLRRAERGQGTTTRAVHLLLLIAFDGIGLPAVDFIAHAENSPSIAVMERVGAVLVGKYPRSERLGSGLEVRYRIPRRGNLLSVDGPTALAQVLLSVR
jgi:RimJ/RimL family protein N-acetyltransferase